MNLRPAPDSAGQARGSSFRLAVSLRPAPDSAGQARGSSFRLAVSLRPAIFRGLVTAGFALLAAGLFNIQVLTGRRYRNLSEQNRIRLIPLEAPRGRVFDRHGKLLATNRPSYNLVATPEDVTPEVFSRLAKILKIKEKEIRKRMSALREYPFAPSLIAEDISRDLVFKIEERKPDLPGVFIQTVGLRYYPYDETASHLIGYIGKISPEEYKQFERERFGMNSLMGRAGIEKIYDERLRGWRGGRQIEVNARGEMIQLLSEKPPEPGEDLTVALDLEFQRKIMEIIKGKRASVAVLDLKTEGLLALASSPAFNPNVFVSPSRDAERIGFLKDPRSPLIDRGVGSAYPPGSVFKLVTALAALETGKITPHTRFFCNGAFRLKPGARPFHCWREGGHQSVNLYEALERSCNVYFYNLGSKISPDTIARYSRELGLGAPMELEATNMTPGLVPDSVWKKERFKEQWYQGETLSFAIGQGYLLTSPVQILRLVSIIAKNGERIEPKLILDQGCLPSSFPAFQGSSSPHGLRRGSLYDDSRLTACGNDELLSPTQKVHDRKIAIKKENLDIIRKGMLQVVQSDYGTGQLARVDFGKLAAKTGTAQVLSKLAHSWMTGFFPYENPQFAFVVFVEHGGPGGITSARIVKSMLEIWQELYAAKVA